MKRPAAAAILAAAQLSVLAGCALPGGSGRSLDDARSVFTSVLDATQVEAGGEWDNRDDPTARGCVIPLFVEGMLYPGLRVSEAPRDPDGAVARVSSLWEGFGFSVEQAIVAGTTELTASGRSIGIVIFRVSDSAMTLHGESECRPAVDR